MNLLKQQSLYPFLGRSAADIPASGSVVVDDTGDVSYGTLWFSNDSVPTSVVFKYVYSTDTLTQLAVVTVTPTAQTYMCWNINKTGFIVWRTLAGVTQFWSVTLAGSVATLATLNETITVMYADAMYGYIGKSSGSKEFRAINPATGAASSIVTLIKYCFPFDVDASYIYTVQATDTPGSGPLVRMHRNKGFLIEFLMGSLAGAASAGATNPGYAGFQSYIGGVSKVNDGIIIAHNPSFSGNSWMLMKYAYADGSVTRLVDTSNFFYVPSQALLAAAPDGSKVYVSLGSSGLLVYG